jgi:hypothetical protein
LYRAGRSVELPRNVHPMKKRLYVWLTMFILAACGPRVPQAVAPTAIPFPTMTPGQQITGSLPTPAAAADTMANPATAVALANRATSTPDYSACPSVDSDISFVAAVESGRSIANGIVAFLNEGGPPDALREGLTAADLLGETGTVADEYDFTGEQVPELLITFTDPGEGGVIVLLTCENRRYVARYRAALGDIAPEVLRVSDMNADGVGDVLLTSPQCSELDGFCEYRTSMITWDASQGQFVNLLLTPPDGDVPPRLGDVDNDRVLEVITVQEGRGTSQTGPLITGSQIYDWNGVSYVLSVAQPAPPRFVIQVLYEADRAFREERMDAAAQLYRTALENDDLAYWFGGDEVGLLATYARYRLLLTYTFAENGDPLTVYNELIDAYGALQTDAPVFAFLADVYWRSYQESNNLNIACNAVLAAIEERPLALDVLNRYGTRNPTYTAQSLCPF